MRSGTAKVGGRWPNYLSEPSGRVTPDASEILDLNMSYRLTDNYKLSFQAKNITDQPRIDYRPVQGQTLQALSYGPRFFFGIKGKF